MQRNVIETVLGAVVLAVAAAFLMFAAKTTDLKPESGYVVTAQFDKIDGLKVGDEVRISGVKVGKIVGFDLDPETYLAVVRMNINDGVGIPADTAAVVTSDGLLGGKFMSLEPGGDEAMLKDGEEITYTQSTPSLEKLLGQVIFNLNKSGGDNGGDAGDDFGDQGMNDLPPPLKKTEKSANPLRSVETAADDAAKQDPTPRGAEKNGAVVARKTGETANSRESGVPANDGMEGVIKRAQVGAQIEPATTIAAEANPEPLDVRDVAAVKAEPISETAARNPDSAKLAAPVTSEKSAHESKGDKTADNTKPTSSASQSDIAPYDGDQEY